MQAGEICVKAHDTFAVGCQQRLIAYTVDRVKTRCQAPQRWEIKKCKPSEPQRWYCGRKWRGKDPLRCKKRFYELAFFPCRFSGMPDDSFDGSIEMEDATCCTMEL